MISKMPTDEEAVILLFHAGEAGSIVTEVSVFNACVAAGWLRETPASSVVKLTPSGMDALKRWKEGESK